jgi:hypothetical protein
LWIAEIAGRSSGAPNAICGSTRVATTLPLAQSP